MKTSKPIPQNESLERAIAHFKSLSDMARQVGVSGYQVIQQWRKSGRVPPEHCTKVAQLTGESRDDLIGWPPLENPDALDDVQPPVGGSSRKTKEARARAV
jgi:DNA-binding transcriptional regulator YdaS (Cro superfamily)